MTTIHCRPDGVDVPIPEGSTVLEALVAAGVPVTHACGGNAKCSTCRIHVVDGAAVCAPRPADEQAMATRLGFEPCTRLACRTRVAGDVTVRRLVLDALDLRLATALGATQAPVAAGRESYAAILFADIVSFTPLSEALPAYDVMHLLDRWFALAGPVIERNGGRIDNYMGDGLLAVFADAGVASDAAGGAGARSERPGGEVGTAGVESDAPVRIVEPAAPAADPAVRAVRAALALVAAAAEMSRYTGASWGRSFAVRVGVHCGTVVVGTLGAAHNRRETVIGDVVNVASRLESENKALGTTVLVSAEVASRLGPSFRLGRTAQVSLKGKSAPQRVHEVLAT